MISNMYRLQYIEEEHEEEEHEEEQENPELLKIIKQKYKLAREYIELEIKIAELKKEDCIEIHKNLINKEIKEDLEKNGYILLKHSFKPIYQICIENKSNCILL